MKITRWIKILAYNLIITLALFLLVDFGYTNFIREPSKFEHPKG